jgi:ribosomal protein S18 acetylase RimI-like enzyme
MNPADIPIVQASWRDLKALRQHEKDCFNKDDAWPLIDLIGTLISPGLVRLKLEVDGRMIGFFAGSTHQRTGFGSVLSISISPDWQGLGLGTRLLEAGEQVLKTPRYELCTRRSNASAIHLYEKAGYIQTDTWKGYYFGEDALVFEKQAIR